MRDRLLAALILTLAGCGDAERAPAPPCAALQEAEADLRARCDIPLGDAATPDSTSKASLTVGVFLLTSPEEGRWNLDEASAIAREGLREARSILGGCDLGLHVEAAQVVTGPPSLIDVEGNHPDAWGGLAPEGEDDPDAFNYAQNERLAPSPRSLFGYTRTYLPPGAIAVVVVDRITFWAAGESEVVGGLAYPPVVYHHPDDHPERNGILVAASYSGPGELPLRVNGRTVAHELGHMLLDTAQHLGEDDNLMKSGTSLTEAQCATMRAAAATVYGPDPIVDPRG